MTARKRLNEYYEPYEEHTSNSLASPNIIEYTDDEEEEEEFEPTVNKNIPPSNNISSWFHDLADTFKRISKTNKTEPVALKITVGALCGAVFIVVFLLYYNHFMTSGRSSKNPHLWKKIYNDLLSKSSHFPSQNSDLWSRITVGLQNLDDEPAKPAVYLLTFGKEAMASSSCIAEIIVLLANTFVLKSNQWLLVNGTVLSKSKSRDPGILVDTLSKEMEYSKMVIITDVQKIPAKLAQGFHFLIDEYNPKIPDAVYIFTMMVPSENELSAEEVVENVLANSWEDLQDDFRNALITRVTNVVLPIQKEMIEACPLKISSTIEVNIP